MISFVNIKFLAYEKLDIRHRADGGKCYEKCNEVNKKIGDSNALWNRQVCAARHPCQRTGLTGLPGCGTASMPADWSYRAAGGDRGHVWTYTAHRLLPTFLFCPCRKGRKEKRKESKERKEEGRKERRKRRKVKGRKEKGTKGGRKERKKEERKKEEGRKKEGKKKEGRKEGRKEKEKRKEGRKVLGSKNPEFEVLGPKTSNSKPRIRSF